MTDASLRADRRWPSFPALLRDAAARFGDGEAVVDGEERLSWNELRARSDAAALAFLAAGIEPGDRVAIWAPNIWEWVAAFLGLSSAGAVLVPINTRYKGEEAAFILRTSRARVLVTLDGFLGNDYVGMLAGEDLPDLELTVVLRSDDPPTRTIGWDGFIAAGSGEDPTEIDRRIAALGPADRSDIFFTSGTTGHPKGVVQTHGAALRGFQAWADGVGLREGDRYLIINPFFHTFGSKAGILACLITGAVMVPLATFDVPAAMRLIEQERISMIPGPPTIYQTFLASPEFKALDTSSLRLAVTGAAAVPVSLVEDMWNVLGFESVVTAYGLTEVCGIATMCRHDDDAETISSTSGRAIPDVEVLIFDDDGKEVRRGEPGEIVIRGYNVMLEYFEDPEQTAETIDAEGWLHSGDIGTMDERGYIKITDRKKDMYISGGFNCYPAEIENLLVRHPAIAQVAVVGVPDERLGEVGVAFAVAVPGQVIDPLEVTAWARQHMANYKVPSRIEVVDALPFNAGGKVLKYQLRERLQEAV